MPVSLFGKFKLHILTQKPREVWELLRQIYA